MRKTFDEALAPGTVKNRQLQAQLYLKFMLAYQFNYFAPSIAQLAMFTRFLGNSYVSPATIKNYLSGAKAWVYSHGGVVDGFLSHEVSMMSKRIATEKAHIVSQARPLTSHDITVICKFINSNHKISPAVKPAILFAFAGFLRVSNVLSPSALQWGGPHTLKMSDVSLVNGKILVQIWSTKTKRSGSPHVLEILQSMFLPTCPVRAWINYVNIVQPYPNGPAFLDSSNKPLTPGPVVGVMREALKSAGLKYANQISFHSLRRGAAQLAFSEGVDEKDIMEHGTWKSRPGLASYIDLPPCIVPRVIARTLAK